MPNFVKVEVGKKAPLVRWLDLDKICLVTATWEEGPSAAILASVRILFTGGITETFRAGEGAQEILSAFCRFAEGG
jgi:hypothetical protein